MTKTLSMDIRVRSRRKILQGKSLDAKPRGEHLGGGKLAGITGFLIELVSQ